MSANKIIFPMRRRGATGTTGAPGADVASLEPRVSALEDPQSDGSKTTVLEYNSGAYVGSSSSSATVRYNVEVTTSNNVAGMIFIVQGYCYIARDIINLMFGCYSTGSAAAFEEEVDFKSGSTRAMGWGQSPNGKTYFWFEANNHYATFNIETIRHPLGNLIDGVSVVVTDSGVEWT